VLAPDPLTWGFIAECRANWTFFSTLLDHGDARANAGRFILMLSVVYQEGSAHSTWVSGSTWNVA